MSEIKVNNGNIEEALKRFKRQCARNGVLQEVRKREHYEKPSVNFKNGLEVKGVSKYLKLPIFVSWFLRRRKKSPKIILKYNKIKK